jgi:hypothetical protein
VAGGFGMAGLCANAPSDKMQMANVSNGRVVFMDFPFNGAAKIIHGDAMIDFGCQGSS